MAPTIAVIQVPRSKKLFSGSMRNRTLANNPPSRAPTMPTTVATTIPVRVPMKRSAMIPVMASSASQEMFPRRSLLGGGAPSAQAGG